MSWSTALNVAAGLVLVYTIFSVAVSRINEFVSSRFQWRAKTLERALHTLLGGDPPPLSSIGRPNSQTPVDPMTGAAAPAGEATLSAKAVKDHPTIAALESASGKNRLASYLPSRALSAVVLDILVPPAFTIIDQIPANDVPADAQPALDALRADPVAANLDAFANALPADSPLRTSTLPRLTSAIQNDPVDQLRTAIAALPESNPARTPLLRMVTDAGNNRDAFRTALEHWYDDEMSRLTGWYKRYVQRFIIVYGVVLTLLFNVDTVAIAQTLWRAPVEQTAIAQAAASAAGKTVDDIDTSVTAIKGLELPLGWTPIHDGTHISTAPSHFPEPALLPWLQKALGLLITIFALSFGTPFWFDVLGRIARLRNSGGVTSTTDDSKRN